MATNYPGSIDSLTNPSAGDSLTSPSHAAQHANANDAIEAIETELGTDPSGSSATVKARFEAIEANDWVTSAKIAADAVGSSEIAANAVGSSELADNAVDTNAIANDAVTSAKIAADAVGSSEIAAGAVGTGELADASVTAAKLAVQPGNLLTANQASVETDTTGWAAYGNATIARSTTQAASGSASLAITVTGAGGTVGAEAAYVDVTPGETYTAVASIRADSTARNVAVQIVWKTSGNAYVSYEAGTAVAGSNSGWVDVNVTAVAPATAVRAVVIPIAYSTVAGEIHYLDKAGLWVGAGGLWQAPGAPIPNLGIRSNPSNSAQAQVWNPGNNTWITV